MTDNKYQRGKIYKLISNQKNSVYYGSTIENKLSNILCGHRSHYKDWIKNKFHYISSFEIVKYEDAKIILVENYPCSTKYELVAREQFYIDNNDCINKRKSYVPCSLQNFSTAVKQQDKITDNQNDSNQI